MSWVLLPAQPIILVVAFYFLMTASKEVSASSLLQLYSVGSDREKFGERKNNHGEPKALLHALTF